GIRIERGCQNAAIAQRARAKLHAAMHPGDDAVIVDLAYSRLDQFLGREQIAEVQLAILQHLLSLLRGEAGSEAEIPHADTRGLVKYVMPAVKDGPQRRPGIPGAGLDKHVRPL